MSQPPPFPVESREIQGRWLPYLTAVLLCLVVFSLWWALEQRESHARRQAIAAESQVLLNLMDADLNNRIRLLQRFVYRWQQRGGMNREEFYFNATSYLEDHPGYQALKWVEPHLSVRWVVPKHDNEEAIGINLALEERRRKALKEARHQQAPSMTAPIELVEGGIGFLIYLPLTVEERFDGFLLAVFCSSTWVEALLKSRHTPLHCQSRILMDGEQIYQAPGWEDLPESLQAAKEWVIRNHHFVVQSRPTAAYLASRHTHLPQLVLIFGLTLIICLVLIIYLLQKTSSAVRSGNRHQNMLELEIAQRQQIEAEREMLLNDIGERVKALHCLYSLSRLAETTGKDVEQFLAEAIECLPPAWQHPEYTTARVSFDDMTFHTRDFQESVWKQEATIQTNGRRRGKVEVFYTKQLPNFDEGPFTEEERYLINEVADRIGSVMQQKRAVVALGKERQRLAFILEGTHVGTWEWNVQTGETVFNSRWAEHLGYHLEELSPASVKTWEKFCHPEDLKKAYRALKRHFSGREPYYQCEIRLKHKDGHWVWILDRGKVSIWTDEGDPLLMFGTHMDISDRKQAEERIRHLANHDALTGLPSLRLVRDRINVALESAHRRHEQFAVMFFDLDGFKAINDQHGHDAGDFVLQTVAKHLLSCVRKSDTVARIGGDEFLLLLTEIKSVEDVENIACKVIETVNQPMDFDGYLLQVQASVGIALYPTHGNTSKVLIKQADSAMYAVKNNGKNGYRFAGPPLENGKSPVV
nr:diguanylate cyclase [uncultured Desulfuromonas sp.]